MFMTNWYQMCKNYQLLLCCKVNYLNQQILHSQLVVRFLRVLPDPAMYYMFMLSFIFVIACYRFKQKRVCVVFLVFFLIPILPLDLIFLIACYLFEWTRVCVSFLVLLFFVSVLSLDLIFMIACYLFLVEVSLCRCSCVVFFIFLYCLWITFL